MVTQTTVLQQQTIADTSADWSQTVRFAQFDPTLGTLQDVRVSIAATVDGTVSVESLEATPSTIGAALSGVVSVTGAGGAFIGTDTVVANGGASLSAYDGVTDYLGNSGTVLAVSQSGTVESIYQPGNAGLAPFIGTGSIDLTASAGVRAGIAGPGSFEIQTASSAGAVVSLQYDYAMTGSGGSSSGGVDTTTVLVSSGPAVDANSVISAPQIFTLADRVTGWNAEVPVARFDPALGRLEAVELTLTGDVAGSLAIQNLETSASTFNATGTATLDMSLPGTVTPGVTVAASYQNSGALAGFDGAIDFAGSLVGQTSPASTTVDLSDPADLAGFIGAGTIDLPIAAAGSSSLDIPGDALARLIGEAGGTVAVSYVYLPADAPSDGFGMLFTAGADLAAFLPTAGPSFAPVAVAQTPPSLTPPATFTPVSVLQAPSSVTPTVTFTPAIVAGSSDPPCFVAGTRIATEDGEVPIEALQIGQRLRCLLGGVAPVVWLGRRHVDCSRHPAPDSVWPVRIRAGAFAPGVPARDLLLSPDHAVYADGVLIPVKRLINGLTVLREAVDSVVYHHVELPRHDIVFAEGLMTESFLDTGGKADFAGGGVMRLHPDFSVLKWEADGCAPLVVTGPALTAARKRLQARVRQGTRAKPSSDQSSVPTPWRTKNRQSGSYARLTARSRG